MGGTLDIGELTHCLSHQLQIVAVVRTHLHLELLDSQAADCGRRRDALQQAGRYYFFVVLLPEYIFDGLANALASEVSLLGHWE
jgi:hypothetical protein